MILAGDCGGTKTRLALCEMENGQLVRRHLKEYPSQKAASLGELIQQFLDEFPASPTAACFGVPGPVNAGTVKVTNLPWQLSESELSRDLNIPKVRLVNDLVATAAAIPYFPKENLQTLHAGEPNPANTVYAVVAPGTGLGHALLHMSDGGHHVLPSEGGHAGFAPTNDLEIQLLQYLMTKFQPVTVERVLCGPGIYNIYSFLRDTGLADEPEELREMISQGDPSVAISKSGMEKKFEICVKTLDMFASMLGSHAGNMMLAYMSLGGVYLGGGIPPKLSGKLAEGLTVRAFLNKGKLSHVVKATPLHIIKDDYAALIGASHLASRL